MLEVKVNGEWIALNEIRDLANYKKEEIEDLRSNFVEEQEAVRMMLERFSSTEEVVEFVKKMQKLFNLNEATLWVSLYYIFLNNDPVDVIEATGELRYIVYDTYNKDKPLKEYLVKWFLMPLMNPECGQVDLIYEFIDKEKLANSLIADGYDVYVSPSGYVVIAEPLF